MNLASLARYGLVSLPHMPGTAFVVIPEPTPRPVFIARPNPPIYGADGERLDEPQGTENQGHATLLAWLQECAPGQARRARVMLPSGPQDFPEHWVHEAGNIPVIRLERARPWRRNVA